MGQNQVPFIIVVSFIQMVLFRMFYNVSLYT